MQFIFFSSIFFINNFCLGKIFGKNLTHNLKTRICPSYLSTLPKSQLDIPQDVQSLPDGKFSILHHELVILNVEHFYFRIQI